MLKPHEAEIRAQLDALVRALRAKDIETLMAHYAPDVVTFDVRPPLHVDGVQAYRKNFEAWFASMKGPLGFEIRDLRIHVDGEIAFAHYLGHVDGTRTYWVRVTAGFRKIDGQWLIAHEHISMPAE